MKRRFVKYLGLGALLSSGHTSGPPSGGDYIIAPPYVVDQDLLDRGNPKGNHFTLSLNLSSSRIYNGSDPTLNKSKAIAKARTVWVYVPAAYVDGAEAAVLVMQDGPFYLGPGAAAISNAMDNLMLTAMSKPAEIARRLPPFVAVAVENGAASMSDAQGSERGLEYDTMSGRYADFIDREVLPAVLADPAIKATYPGLRFTRDPRARAAVGCSSGGAAALSMGWFRSNLFGLVAAYSGTFVDQQDHRLPEVAAFRYGAWEYHSDRALIASTSPQQPLRIFTHCSEHDLGTPTACLFNGTGAVRFPNRTAGWNAGATDWATDGHHNWQLAGNRTAAALRLKGYEYRHVFSTGACHCDGRVLLQTLVDMLVWLWHGSPRQT